MLKPTLQIRHVHLSKWNCTPSRIFTIYSEVVVAPVFRARLSGSVCKGDVVRRGTHQLVVLLCSYGERWTFDGTVINCVHPRVGWWWMTFPGTSYHRASRNRRTVPGTRYPHVLWTVWKHTDVQNNKLSYRSSAVQFSFKKSFAQVLFL